MIHSSTFDKYKKVCVRSLNEDLLQKKSEKTLQMLRKIKTTVDRLNLIAYGGVKRMLRSKFKTKKTTKMRELFLKQSEKMELFCSELVSLFLNEIGVLKQVRLLPEDF